MRVRISPLDIEIFYDYRLSLNGEPATKKLVIAPDNGQKRIQGKIGNKKKIEKKGERKRERKKE